MPSARTLSRLSTTALVVALVLALAVAAIGLREMREFDEASAWVRHTHEVLAASDHVFQLVTEIEGGARGYSVTGDGATLDSYRAARDALAPALRELAALVRDNPEQGARVAALRAAAEARAAHATGVVELRDREGESAALARINAGEGIRLMEVVRERKGALEGAEETLLAEREARRSLQRRRAWLSLLVLAGSAPLFLAAAWSFNRRALRQLETAQQMALAGEARLRVTLESCGDAIIASDAAGHVTLMNPTAEALTGWRIAEARGLPIDQIFRIVNEFTRETVESPVIRALSEGKVVGLANHTLLLARDGREIPIDDSGAPILDDTRHPIGVILVFRDVTGRKLAEQSRERMLRAEAERQAAVDANRAKDQFLAVVSHELRAPLAAMRGWIELLRGGHLPAADQSGALERIERNARLQERLINDLLDMSRIVAGKLEIVRSPLDLRGVVAAGIETSRKLAAQQGVQLSHERPSVVPLVQGDEQRLVQVVSNLVHNGIKFTPRGGSVRVALLAEDGKARIVVEDTGIGMECRVLERLFDRFFQADAVPSRAQGGLGLGLAIARYIVEEHEGSLHAESDGAGRGSRFTVEMPLVESGTTPARPSEPEAEGPGDDLRGLTVLVVDDALDSRDAAAIYLASRGAHVVTAGSVAEALAAYERAAPQIVVSDIGMPGEDGYALARAIRQREAGKVRLTSLIALTGFTAPADRRATLEQGFDAHLGKPLDLAELARVVGLMGRKP